MAIVSPKLHVLGLGGTLRDPSTSLSALRVALEAAAQAGATTELLSLRELDLPMYDPDAKLDDYGSNVRRYVEALRRADAMIWSTAAYHGTLAGVTKNAIDFFQLLSDEQPPFLHDRVVGLIATAGGDLAATNAIGALVHSVHSLRGTVAPLLVAIPNASKAFEGRQRLVDDKWRGRLEQLGRLVVLNASRFQPLELAAGR